jgi:type I restriction enzyme S subunit
MTQHINIPNLRFPEFKEEWEMKKVGELCDSIVPGRNKPTNFEGDIPWITTPDIEHNGIINFSKKGLNISKEEARKVGSKIVPINSVIISCVGELGLSAIAGKEIIINQQLHAFIPKEKIEYRFLLYQLNLKKEYMDKVATKTAVPYMNKDNCNSIPIDFPTLPEQQKIATFLTAVDEKLQALKQKKSLLEQYKKGVMQKIFSQELRFKDDNGNAFSDWEEKKLGEVAEKRIIKNKDNKINLVFTNSALQGIVNQRDFFDKDIANQNNLLGYYLVEKNDFIYNPRISNLAPVGPISRNHLDTGIMSPLYSVFRFKEGSLDFIEHFFNSPVWYLHMKDISNYGARDDRMSFSTGDFYKMPIPFPTLSEQTKIANFLSAIDEKINQCEAQITKTEVYKKGLLQGMFV